MKSPEERYATASEFVEALTKARRNASRERMWRQLGGTTPPPKSGEWHGKREFNAIAEGVHAAEAAAAVQRVTEVRIPVGGASGGDAVPASPAGEQRPEVDSPPKPQGASAMTRTVIAAAVVALSAVVWALLR